MQEAEKVCCLCFDKMALMKKMEYSDSMDIVEGFQDLGSLGRSDVIASTALVFMLRGLYSRWKLPIMYVVAGNCVKWDSLKKLLLETIGRIMDCGLQPVCIVCDQGTNNRSALSSLGVCAERTYFHFRENKILALYDVPHLFKSFRNNLLNGDYDFEENKITLRDVRSTYDIDIKSKGARALIKITPAHLNPNPFQKLSCKLALQIFSRTVAATISTCIASGQLTSSSAKSTANFILEMDHIFDVLNSRTLYSSNPYQFALSEKNNVGITTLQKGLEIFTILKKLISMGELADLRVSME